MSAPPIEVQSAANKDENNTALFCPDPFPIGQSNRVQIDLNGTWEFRRDPDNIGMKEGWHKGNGLFSETMQIPGAPQSQGFGEPNYRRKNYFMEPFWVRRSFQLPEVDTQEIVWLRIGGILPAAEIYLNGKYLGYTKSSRTQQRVDITNLVRPSGRNSIAVKICDFPEVRLDGLWEMDELGTKWSGIYRPIACEITNRNAIIDTYVQPRLFSGTVEVDVDLYEEAQSPLILHLSVRDNDTLIGQTERPISHKATGTVKLAKYKTWSPKHPQLYDLEIAILEKASGITLDKARIRFGMREIVAHGTKFYLNGNPIFLRCYGEDQYYTETIYPPADKDYYLSRLKRARAYGMNAVKSCVEILPQEYIEAADEAGIMVIQEMPFGLSGLRANRYTIDDRFMTYYAKELDGLVRDSRNHASVIAYSMSSEMEFSNQTQASFEYFSQDLVSQTRILAPHALLIDCTGYLDSEDTAKGKRDTDFYAHIIPTWCKEVLDETPINTGPSAPLHST